ncbi:MarR family winged helix-turn-helix transcriptional regulator [Methanospirillum lacunae]|uniref:HTH marR-type domain-containing protein n=1 Tax=Methanospirillum lacunae TaxID=668570 RepID=A0A2V2N5D1_9EURY|nr:MarR family transcriptional regulator [Methanospirillum lacunae]PWR71417.1 hypothetical protein DK846_11165 [Methanospirillum lacunae]
MDKTVESKAVDCLMEIIELYHNVLFLAERKTNTGIQELKLRLLIQLYEIPMLSMSQLGKLLYISKPHMTTLVDSLVIEGLIERHNDQNDRRVINISITQKGRKQLELFKEQMRNMIQNRISSLPEGDLRALCRSGEKFIEIVSKVH